MLLMWPFSNVLYFGESSSKAMPLQWLLESHREVGSYDLLPQGMERKGDLLISYHNHQCLLRNTDFLKHIHNLSNPCIDIFYGI